MRLQAREGSSRSRKWDLACLRTAWTLGLPLGRRCPQAMDFKKQNKAKTFHFTS